MVKCKTISKGSQRNSRAYIKALRPCSRYYVPCLAGVEEILP